MFTLDDAISVGREIGIDWDSADFSPDDLLKGMEVELEHGTALDERVNITDDDPVLTAKIAWAHLMESPLYYEFLEQMERNMEAVSSYISGDAREKAAGMIKIAESSDSAVAHILLEAAEKLLDL